MHKDVLNFVCLLNLDADPDAVDARLDEDFLVLVPCNRQRIKKHLGRTDGFDFGYIMSL